MTPVRVAAVITFAALLHGCGDRVCEPLADIPFKFDEDASALAKEAFTKVGPTVIVLTGAGDHFPASAQNEDRIAKLLESGALNPQEDVLPIYIDDVRMDQGCNGKTEGMEAFVTKWNDTMLAEIDHRSSPAKAGAQAAR